MVYRIFALKLCKPYCERVAWEQLRVGLYIHCQAIFQCFRGCLYVYASFLDVAGLIISVASFVNCVSYQPMTSQLALSQLGCQLIGGVPTDEIVNNAKGKPRLHAEADLRTI